MGVTLTEKKQPPQTYIPDTAIEVRNDIKNLFVYDLQIC